MQTYEQNCAEIEMGGSVCKIFQLVTTNVLSLPYQVMASEFY
jgi:hypothetical protein